jgi:antitoxin CcdA
MRTGHAHDPGTWGHASELWQARCGREPLRLEGGAGAKRATNLSVRGDLIDAARAARVNLSALLERAVTEELIRLKGRQWREENGPAIAAYNRYVTEHGAFCRIGLRWGCRSSPFT